MEKNIWIGVALGKKNSKDSILEATLGTKEQSRRMDDIYCINSARYGLTRQRFHRRKDIV